MKTIILLAVAVAALTNSVQAKLGETINQVEARYGSPVLSGTDENNHLAWRRYAYQDYDIIVRYIGDKSVCEKLLHRSESKKFSEVEALGLGKAISGESNWVLFDHKGPAIAWTSGEAMVLRSEMAPGTLPPFLEVTGKAYRDHMSEMREADSLKQIDAIAAKFDRPVTRANR